MEGITKRYCVIKYPLGSVSVITELTEKITAVTLKVSIKTFGCMTERYCCSPEAGSEKQVTLSVKKTQHL